ncbi:MAG: hypothetical protein LBI48_09545 [Burkholderiaceae bacterium]|jgi:hypothetical protein|nr:hypothetical protein [Burkholderiaceae bacterium]
MNPEFHTGTALAGALRKILRRLEQEIAPDAPICVYLAGGMAVHLYTGKRVTTDIDAEFSRRIVLPPDLTVDVTLEDGSEKLVYLDGNYNSTFGLMHEDYLEDALPINLGTGKFSVCVLAPVDLAVSKIARLADSDKEDIAELARAGLTTAEAIEQRAREAAKYCAAPPVLLEYNIRDAVEIARQAQTQKTPEQPLQERRWLSPKHQRGGLER